ncbi:FAD/NAD(P)-binding domain-containing protein [Auricularia subglabra TFB-10046 SS5]|nr:FAD/NAD(P)-binding domain-containing protein [Auricularia subglabra TFB-10046 SS5]
MSPSPSETASAWLAKFEELCSDSEPDLHRVFTAEDCWLRDLLTLSSDFRTLHGHEEIKTYLANAAALKDFRLDVARLTEGSVVLLFDFQIAAAESGNFIAPVDATGRGCARLVMSQDGDWRSWTVLLALHNLVGHEEDIGRAKASISEQTWDDAWAVSCASIKDDLAVLIVGGGQSGLMTAARLKQMGVRTLVIDRKKVGDSWGDRYSLLKLHTPIQMNSFPYHPWPDTWPKYLPKSKMARFMRAYAEIQDLLVWESTELLSDPRPAYDNATRTWTVHVMRDSGIQVLHPRHIVMATGVARIPRLPNIPGLNEFNGTVLHSSEHTNASGWKGKRVVVVGACNSGADIALDSLRNGVAEVTIVQRSATTVMSMPAMEAFMFNHLYPDVTDMKLEQHDLISNTVPHPAIIARLRNGGFAHMQEMDRALLDGLAAAGFKTSAVPLYELLVGKAGGFIEDQGAMPEIISGRIKVKHGVEVARLEDGMVVFTDGSTLPADVLVLATGFENIRVAVRDVFGDELFEQTTDVWGLDGQGEIKGIYRPSGHSAFWYAAGDFGHARFLGRFLALQILAAETARSYDHSSKLSRDD